MCSDGTTVLCDVSTGRPRPWIPASLRRHVFDLIHGLAHPSRRATAHLLKQKFVWHGISRDAKDWVRACPACQTTQDSEAHQDGPCVLSPATATFWPHPCRCGGSPSSFRGVSLPLHHHGPFDEVARSCSDGRRHCCILLRCPALWLWTSMGELLGVDIHHTTAYNPEANGIVERFHRTLKAALMSRCRSATWSSQLLWVLLGLRTASKEGLGVSSAEMVYGYSLVVPGEFFPDASSCGDLARLHRIVGKFAPCKQTPPLTPPYTGPYEVVARKEKAFLLRIKGADDWVSIDRLKSAYLQDDDPPPVQLSRAGRPLSRAPRHLCQGGGSIVAAPRTHN
ncbi:uncharacterized protein LOC123509264 [Portunus trituberculatus]|uniref:uncharacterized protein LOC123509264 n=1 Tax=Portunus trituberculatus TaxID=210409 RepID=UPI001E1CCB56|nr:uncharacterized protein LOC123509264 [Portunus trituberculatus]